MIKKENLPKAYTEVLEILNNISKEEYKKVPKELIELYELKKDKQYKFEITYFEDFENKKILDETKAILAVLFRDYWATEKQREKIILNEKHQINIQEEQKRKEYNPDEIFRNKNSEID